MKIKDLLQPPFENDNQISIYDQAGNHFEIIIKMFYPAIEEIYYKVLNWITSALNEKAEREFSERKKWLTNGYPDQMQCPYCKNTFLRHPAYEWCPRCGKPLDYPAPIF